MTQIGFGTAALGRPLYINIRQNGEARTGSFDLEMFKSDGIEMLESAYQLGIRYFDTAPGYGIAEQMLSEWVTAKNDSTIQVATKWGYTYVANFRPDAKVHEVKDHSLAKLNEQWKHSIQLLPHLSIYQIHSATPESHVLENKEVLERLRQLKKQFNIQLGITVSGAHQSEIILAALEIKISGKPLFDYYQATFNVFEQSILSVLDALKKENAKIVVKEALANGRVFQNAQYPQYIPQFELLNKLAKKYHVGVDAVAIRFCADCLQPNVVLSGATNMENLKDNLLAYNFRLEPDEIDAFKLLRVSPEIYWQERSKLNFN